MKMMCYNMCSDEYYEKEGLESVMKKIIVFLMIVIGVFLTGCQDNKLSDGKTDIEKQEKSVMQGDNKILLSNMSDEMSIKEVSAVLNKYLNDKSVKSFIAGVIQYNEAVENLGLTGTFENKEQPEYNVSELERLWASKHSNFIGTDCRINTFMLLKNDIKVHKGTIDDALLFMDNDAIRAGNIFDRKETEQFKQLFSRVKTKNTKDINMHYNKMKEHFSKIKFNKNAEMISVVLNDNLDGEYLFIGHVGVLIKNNGKYLFIEKLSFQEPFQAIKFKHKEDCYKYLFSKYKNYSDETEAKPFIMNNDKLIQM